MDDIEVGSIVKIRFVAHIKYKPYDFYIEGKVIDVDYNHVVVLYLEPLQGIKYIREVKPKHQIIKI